MFLKNVNTLYSNKFITFTILILFHVMAFCETDNLPNQMESGSDSYRNKLPVNDPEIILTLQGSNTIGQSLAPKLATEYLQTLNAKSTMIVKGNVENEVVIQAILPSLKNAVGIKIMAHGSSTAFKGFEKNRIDIGMSSRSIHDEEISRLLVSHGDLSLSENETVVGMDGIAIIVHPNNPVTKLTIDQLADIFSGNITNWSELDGNDSKINLFSRDENSGTYDTFKSLVLNPHHLKISDTARLYESNTELSKSVSEDINGIGFTGMAYTFENKVVKVAASKGSPYFLPTKSLVNTEDYPLSRRLLLYSSGRNVSNKYIPDFIQFATSEKGQSVVDKEEFVSQNIFIIDGNISANSPLEYQNITNGLSRLSLNFRLKENVAKLDSKSHRDLDRLARYIKKNNIRDIHAIGFSGFSNQNKGFLQDSKSNKRRSVRLAYIIAIGLRERGIRNVKTTGLGEIMPIIHSENEGADSKNSRVEIWVK